MINEEWKAVQGFEGAYEVSSLGQVRSLDRLITSSDQRQWVQRGRLLVIDYNHNGGYGTLQLCLHNRPKRYLVHRLVAIAFLPNPDNLPEVNHRSGIKTDNRKTNLEWALRQGNIDHAVSTGLIANKGSLNSQAKLDEATVRKMRRMRADGMSIREIAIATGATPRNVRNIVSYVSWKHLEMDAA